MPIGVLINAASVFVGGILGALLKKYIREDVKQQLSLIFGVCALGMGIASVVLMKNMPAVIFSVAVGTAIGLLIHFESWVQKMGRILQEMISKIIPQKNRSMSEAEFDQTLLTIIVLFCASGTGIYGSIVSGMYGDHSILISKSILDLFTAMIFACSLGGVVSFVAVPQLVIFLLLFYGGSLLYPLTTPAMIDDFKAAGGILLLATGFRMMRVKMFPTADMIPAMVIVMPISWFWTNCVVPFL